MAFIKKGSIPISIRRDMRKKAGFREEKNMSGAQWITSSKDGDRIKFIRKNPNYGRKGDSTKTYHSTYSIKRHGWIG